MAKKKMITREQILAATYEVAATSGFTRFTARNIVNKMNCSTQPTYLGFENTDNLKQALFEQTHNHSQYEVFTVKYTENTIIDLAFSCIHLAKRGKELYRSLYLEEYSRGKEVQSFSYTYFVNTVKRDPTYVDLSEKQIESLYDGAWAIATRIAALMSSSVVHPTDERIEKMIQNNIDAILKFKELIEVD